VTTVESTDDSVKPRTAVRPQIVWFAVRMLIRPVRVLEKTALWSSRLLQQSDGEEWLDREIALLRQSVETEALSQEARDRGAEARSPWRQLRLFGATRAGAGWIASRALRVPMRFNCLLGRLLRIVYTRRFDIAWYGFALALAVAAGWLLSSILNP
jgi:hypothetical protein